MDAIAAAVGDLAATTSSGDVLVGRNHLRRENASHKNQCRLHSGARKHPFHHGAKSFIDLYRRKETGKQPIIGSIIPCQQKLCTRASCDKALTFQGNLNTLNTICPRNLFTFVGMMSAYNQTNSLPKRRRRRHVQMRQGAAAPYRKRSFYDANLIKWVCITYALFTP